MTLNLLLAPRPRERRIVIIADPVGPNGITEPLRSPGGWVESLVTGLGQELDQVQRLMFPLPDDTTRRAVAAPALLRSRHAELWYALSEDERRRTILVAGATAAYLAPVVGEEADTFVVVHDPHELRGPGMHAWRTVLGPYEEFDQIPEQPGSHDERNRWLIQIRTATSGLKLVQEIDLAALASQTAAAVELDADSTRRATAIVAAALAGTVGARRGKKPAHWLNEVLFSLAGSQERQRRGEIG